MAHYDQAEGYAVAFYNNAISKTFLPNLLTFTARRGILPARDHRGLEIERIGGTGRATHTELRHPRASR